MAENQSSYPAARIAGSRIGRGLIASLFTAGSSFACMNLFELVLPDLQPYVFGLVFLFGFVGCQIQERMRRMTSPE